MACKSFIGLQSCSTNITLMEGKNCSIEWSTKTIRHWKLLPKLYSYLRYRLQLDSNPDLRSEWSTREHLSTDPHWTKSQFYVARSQKRYHLTVNKLHSANEFYKTINRYSRFVVIKCEKDTNKYTNLKKSFSKIFNIAFNWQKINALCWLTMQFDFVTSSISVEAPIPQSSKSCLQIQ